MNKYCYVCKTERRVIMSEECDIDDGYLVRVPYCSTAYQIVRKVEIAIEAIDINLEEMDKLKIKRSKLRQQLNIGE